MYIPLALHKFISKKASNSCIKLILIILCSLLILSCATSSIVYPPVSPFPNKIIDTIISGLREQEKMCHGFVFSGRMTIKKGVQKTRLILFIAGQSSPLKIKMEINHPWGRPLFKILIQKTGVEILSIQEKKYYFGPLESFSKLFSFFPVQLDSNQLWMLARCFPVVLPHVQAISGKANQLTLFNENSEAIQVMSFDPGTTFPRQISFPSQDAVFLFSEFTKSKDIPYACKVRLNLEKVNTTLTIINKNMLFKKRLNPSIFILPIPPDFITIPLLPGMR